MASAGMFVDWMPRYNPSQEKVFRRSNEKGFRMKNSLRAKFMVISVSFLIIAASFYVSYERLVVLPRQREAIAICRALGGYERNLGCKQSFSPPANQLEHICRRLRTVYDRIISQLQRDPPHRFTFAEPVSDENIESIQYLSDIVELNLKSRGITDRTLQRILEPSQLRWLTIENANITDQGLESIRKAPLSCLEIINSRITHAGLFQLNLSELSYLEVNLSLLSESTREERRKLATVETLRVSPDNRPSHNCDWTFLRGCTCVKSLTVRTPVDDAGVAEIAQLTKLESLFLKGVHDRHLDQFGRMPGLKSLDATGDFTGSGLESWSGSAIKLLTLKSESLNGSSLASLAGMSGLRDLRVQSPRLTVAGTTQLAQSPSLRCLEIEDANISDDDAIQFRLFPKLKRLTLRNTRLTPAGARTIRASFPDLILEISPYKGEGVLSKSSIEIR